MGQKDVPQVKEGWGRAAPCFLGGVEESHPLLPAQGSIAPWRVLAFRTLPKEEGICSGGLCRVHVACICQYLQIYEHTDFFYGLFFVSPLNNPANDRNRLLYFALPM